MCQIYTKVVIAYGSQISEFHGAENNKKEIKHRTFFFLSKNIDTEQNKKVAVYYHRCFI